MFLVNSCIISQATELTVLNVRKTKKFPMSLSSGNSLPSVSEYIWLTNIPVLSEIIARQVFAVRRLRSRIECGYSFDQEQD
jgi:hypothetical protein